MHYRRAMPMMKPSLRSFLSGLLLVGAAGFSGDVAASASAHHSRARCIEEALAPITTDIKVSVLGLPARSAALLQIGWRGASRIPPSCDLHRSVGANVVVRFAKPPQPYSFSAGYPSRWLVFLGSRNKAEHGQAVYDGISVEGDALGCVRSVRAQLRYRAVAPGGVVVGRRIRSVPAHATPSCHGRTAPTLLSP
jgi:hypothetical protein